MAPLTWLSEQSASAVGAAVRRVAPSLAELPITLQLKQDEVDPYWFSGSARIGDTHMAKFAWSEVAARRTRREGRVLQALHALAPDLPLPEVVASSADPVLIVTRIVPGRPLTPAGIAAHSDAGVDSIATDLARFLAALHDPSLLDAVQRVVPLKTPDGQADTDSLRAGLGRWVAARQRETVLRWCDWTDAVFARTPPRNVLVHGDFHGHNQIWDLTVPALRAVLDYDITGPGDAEFDLRCLPSDVPDFDVVLRVIGCYERESGRALDLERVMAWHLRTALGDVLWRSEAHIPLPGGGTPVSWVDDLAARMTRAGLE
ncbi:MAG TPA: phosphotransferase [Mycobacteriales bacterium]|nr:phosphotransferase [Mycobacteriales bacterium]